MVSYSLFSIDADKGYRAHNYERNRSNIVQTGIPVSPAVGDHEHQATKAHGNEAPSDCLTYGWVDSLQIFSGASR